MKNSTKAVIVGAAMAGLFSGTAVRATTLINGNAGSSINQMDDTSKSSDKNSCKGQNSCNGKTDKNACKGHNSCKGKGGCKTDSNSCKGQNSCKGKGGCATDGSKK